MIQHDYCHKMKIILLFSLIMQGCFWKKIPPRPSLPLHPTFSEIGDPPLITSPMYHFEQPRAIATAPLPCMGMHPLHLQDFMGNFGILLKFRKFTGCIPI